MSKSHDPVTVDYAIVGGTYFSRYIILFFVLKDLLVINSLTLTLIQPRMPCMEYQIRCRRKPAVALENCVVRSLSIDR